MANLGTYDYIVINTSGGKDSQAMMHMVVGMAIEAGVLDRVIAVHADLGRVEWEGTRELAERQAAAYGITRFEVVSRERGDLLDQILDRRVSLDTKSERLAGLAAGADAPVDVLGAAVVATLRAKSAEAYASAAFPSSKARFCTSDQKTSQVVKLFTRLVEESTVEGRPVRILNCLGLRADESTERANKAPFGPDCASNGLRHIDRWLPIHHWSEDEVWATIKASGVEYHRAYDLGMTRLSCVFCVFASKRDLTIAAKHNPELAREYVEVEILTRSRFKNDLSMTDIIALAEEN